MCVSDSEDMLGMRCKVKFFQVCLDEEKKKEMRRSRALGGGGGERALEVGR